MKRSGNGGKGGIKFRTTFASWRLSLNLKMSLEINVIRSGQGNKTSIRFSHIGMRGSKASICFSHFSMLLKNFRWIQELASNDVKEEVENSQLGTNYFKITYRKCITYITNGYIVDSFKALSGRNLWTSLVQRLA